MAYYFSLIRFVPDPGRGEFVNIGAVVGDDAGDWSARWISNFTRAKALDSHGYLASAKAFTALVDDRVDVEQLDLYTDPPSLEWLRELATDMNNVVQLSDPAPVVAESAEGALDLVFDRLLVDPARATYRFRKKHQAQAATRRAYRAQELGDAVTPRSRVTSGAFEFDFDFAVHNGQAVQLAQCWSFELPNQTELTEQVKAWAWMVHEVRRSGGRLVTEADVEVPQEIAVASVYIPPLEDTTAFEEAASAFDELEVMAVPLDQAETVGEAAKQLLSQPASPTSQ